jgi:putative effector of murein hydrolase
MKNDKLRLTIITVGTILLLAGAALYASQSIITKEKNLGDLIPFLITVTVVLFMIFFIKRRYKDIKEGMPMEDERSKKVLMQAAAASFQFSLYWLLAISWFEPFFARVLFGAQKLDASQTVGGAIAGMAIFFFIFWFYYDKKGKLI